MALRTTLSACVISTLGITATASTHHVSVAGDDSNTGNSAATALSSIQLAIDRAQAGDTVLVYPGTYKGFVLRDVYGEPGRPIVLLAQAEGVEVNAPGDASGLFGVRIVGSAHVHLEGFTFRDLSKDALLIERTKHLSVRGSAFVDNAGYGIHMDQVHVVTIAENNIFGNYQGVYATGGATELRIMDNIFQKNYDSGIHLQNALEVVVANNQLLANGTGGGAAIHFDAVEGGFIRNNVLWSNMAAGVTITGSTHGLSKGTRLLNNAIVGAESSQWAVIITDAGVNSLLLNNILHAPQQGGGVLRMSEIAASTIYSDHNLVSGGVSMDNGATVISFLDWRTDHRELGSVEFARPEDVFKDVRAGDLRASSESAPQVDAGASTVLRYVSSDINGLRRPQGAGVDIGPFELESSVSVAATAQARMLTVQYMDGHLVVPGARNGDRIVVYDATGRRVARFTATSDIVRQPFNQPTGVYIVESVSRNEGRMVGRVAVP